MPIYDFWLLIFLYLSFLQLSSPQNSTSWTISAILKPSRRFWHKPLSCLKHGTQYNSCEDAICLLGLMKQWRFSWSASQSSVTTPTTTGFTRQLESWLTYCHWLSLTLILYYEYWTINGYLKMLNHHLEKILRKQKGTFEGTKVSFHSIQDSCFWTQRISIWINARPFKTFLWLAGGKGCMWKNFFVVGAKSPGWVISNGVTVQKRKNQSLFLNPWMMKLKECEETLKRKWPAMLRKSGGSSTSSWEMSCRNISCLLPLRLAPTGGIIAEGLLGCLALVTWWRLLEALKRDKGKEPPPLARTWLYPPYSSRKPICSNYSKTSSWSSRCTICVCVRTTNTNLKMILWWRSLSFYSPSFSENYKYSLGITGRAKVN